MQTEWPPKVLCLEADYLYSRAVPVICSILSICRVSQYSVVLGTRTQHYTALIFGNRYLVKKLTSIHQYSIGPLISTGDQKTETSGRNSATSLTLVFH